MSVITETEPGGEMVCILGFSARPRGRDNQPIASAQRTFRVGERVRYVTFFYKNTPHDNPTGFMAVFEPLHSADKNRYAATQDYFVTADCWEGLRKYFASARRALVGTNSSGKRAKKISSKGATAKISARPARTQTAPAPLRRKSTRKDA